MKKLLVLKTGSIVFAVGSILGCEGMVTTIRTSLPEKQIVMVQASPTPSLAAPVFPLKTLFKNPGQFAYTIPHGAKSLKVYLYGGGGGGSGRPKFENFAITNPRIQGGAGGGFLHFTLTELEANQVFLLKVGRGGEGTLDAKGLDGGESSISTLSDSKFNLSCTATGGIGGTYIAAGGMMLPTPPGTTGLNYVDFLSPAIGGSSGCKERLPEMISFRGGNGGVTNDHGNRGSSGGGGAGISSAGYDGGSQYWSEIADTTKYGYYGGNGSGNKNLGGSGGSTLSLRKNIELSMGASSPDITADFEGGGGGVGIRLETGKDADISGGFPGGGGGSNAFGVKGGNGASGAVVIVAE